MNETPSKKRAYWKQHIDAWEHSGESQAAYCRRHQLKVHQMIYWRQVFSDDHPLADDGFVAIDLSTASQASDLTLTLSNGVKISGITSENLGLVRALIGV